MYLVIGAGGMTFFSFLGSLSQINFDTIDEVSGASAGSVLGLFICAGKTFEEIIEFCYNLDFKELSKMNIISFITKFGVISHEPIKKVFKNFIGGDLTFKQLSKKLHVAAFCVNKTETEYFSVDNAPDMSVIDAVCMSISVPFLFESIKYNSFTYVDGGLQEFVPIMAFLNKDPNDILIIRREVDKILLPEIKTVKSFINGIIQIISTSHSDSFYKRSKNIIINVGNVNIFDFSLSHEEKLKLYMIGYQAANGILKS